MNTFFRMSVDGRVVGISEGDEATALMNLGEGQFLLPFDEAVDPTTDRWIDDEWITTTERSRPEDDPNFMRRTGYPVITDQVGVLMKIATYVIAGEEVPQGVKDEFLAIQQVIANVKADNPKP